MGLFSEYLVEALTDFENDREPDATAEDRRAVEFVRRLCEVLVEGKMSWLTARHTKERSLLSSLETSPELLDVEADRILSRHALETADSVVQRIREVPSILLLRHPSSSVRTCLVEATRCYVFGLFQASAVMSRAAVQAALEDCLRARRSNLWHIQELARPPIRDWIRKWLEQARSERIISNEVYESLGRAISIGNRAAHGRTITGSDALWALKTVRDAVEMLYR